MSKVLDVVAGILVSSCGSRLLDGQRNLTGVGVACETGTARKPLTTPNNPHGRSMIDGTRETTGPSIGWRNDCSTSRVPDCAILSRRSLPCTSRSSRLPSNSACAEWVELTFSA